jgi:hypothetical protein
LRNIIIRKKIKEKRKKDMKQKRKRKKDNKLHKVHITLLNINSDCFFFSLLSKLFRIFTIFLRKVIFVDFIVDIDY